MKGRAVYGAEGIVLDAGWWIDHPQRIGGGSKGMSSNSVYAATKAAVRSFARTWTTDLKARHIRVNALSPGPIDTEGLRELLGSSQAGQDRLKSIGTTVPMGRLGLPDEVAKAAVFWPRMIAVTSPGSSYSSTAVLLRCNYPTSWVASQVVGQPVQAHLRRPIAQAHWSPVGPPC